LRRRRPPVRLDAMLTAPLLLALTVAPADASTPPDGPPPPALVLKALPKVPFGNIRTYDSVEYEELLPGYWKCSVYYRNSFVVPLGIVLRSTPRRQDVYVDQRRKQ
jgi:hypothetical protein